MNLSRNDKIITAFAEYCIGLGWSNQVVNVVVQGEDGSLRIEGMQIEEQTPEMRTLFAVSCACHTAMTHAVKRLNLDETT